MKGKVRMTLVVDADLNDGEYLIPDDFVPPFLSAPTPAVVPTPELEAPPVELLQPEVASSSPVSPPTLNGPLLAPVLDEVRDEMTLAAAPTKKKRTLWGIIRAGWFVLFTVAGESLTYALNNLTTLNLPPGTATAVGAVGYGLKKGIWPDTTL